MVYSIARCAAQRQRSLFTSIRTYATAATARSRPLPTPRKPLPPVKTKPRTDPETIVDRIKYRNLEKLYDEGKHVLFKIGSQRAFITASWSIAFAGSLVTFMLLSLRDWDYNENKKRRVPYPGPIAGANLLALAGAAFVSAFCFLRPSNFILAIRLVRKEGDFRLAVDRRRILPFIKPKTYMVLPKDLYLSRTVVSYIGSPEESSTRVGAQAKRAAQTGSFFTKLWAVPYSAMRKVFFFEGVVRTYIPEEGKPDKMMLQLDTNGKTFEEVKDLLEVANIEY